MAASVIITLIACAIAIAFGIWIIVFYGSKQMKKQKELYEADGLYDENHYWRKAFLFWLPFYAITAVIVFVFYSKWGDSLKELFIVVNVLYMFAPPKIIQVFLIKKNRDKIRPRQPLPTGARIIYYLTWFIMALYIMYQVYIFVSGKPVY
jgi:hypothetical protein